jgi:hypothetical protein
MRGMKFIFFAATPTAPTTGPVFLLAFLGALGAQLYRLEHRWWKLKREHFSWYSMGYILVCLCNMGVAGVFAVVLPADNLRSAFYVGATADLVLGRLFKRGRGSGALEAANAKGKNTTLFNDIKAVVQDHADDLF